MALAHSDHDTAGNRFEQALRLYESAGDLLGQTNCTFSLGDIALARSDYDTARAHYEKARILYERVGDPLGLANSIHRLGDIALRPAPTMAQLVSDTNMRAFFTRASATCSGRRTAFNA